MVDLKPAQWIWLPSERTLANTFVLFRKSFELTEVPNEANGWVTADSRYRLTVNGHRVQWGPAPFDPRHAEVDPFDLAPYLTRGENVIGVEVLFFGTGDGTWPFGKPGLLFKSNLGIVSDASWRCIVDRAHRPGQPKRWYLRALQEEFDARLHPYGWDLPGFEDAGWLNAQAFENPSTRAAFASRYSDYINEVWMSDPSESTLIERPIPMMHEHWVPATLEHQGSITWHRDPADWFDFRVPGSMTVTRNGTDGDGEYTTYALPEGVVGWPSFRIHAPEGTQVELTVHEAHDPINHPWLDSHFYCWSRFICREGDNLFETFDFEAAKWIQLHVHGHSSPVTISQVGVRRRTYPWPVQPVVQVDEPDLQRLLEANINTLNNSAQETIVDGMGRERQQYSGDCGHQIHPIIQTLGDTQLPARFLRTYAQGQFLDGVFADSWPGYDRLARIWERNVDASDWGPIIDHSVGFVFDHFHYWMHTGDTSLTQLNCGRLLRFTDFLERSIASDGMLPVENLGQNAVWIDHVAFRRQSEKRCAFNLYVAAMLQHALAPMVPSEARRLVDLATAILEGTQATYWESDCFVNSDEGRMDDRSLATAVLYNQGAPQRMVELLANPPENLGMSYPPNLVWNYWALIKAGRIQSVLDDLRKRWAPMRSVIENNTLSEFFEVHNDRPNLMSHCPMAPLIVFHQGILGLQPLAPGYEELEIRPQLGDLRFVHLQSHTPRGVIEFRATPTHIRVQLPKGVEAQFVWLGERHRVTGDIEVPSSSA